MANSIDKALTKKRKDDKNKREDDIEKLKHNWKVRILSLSTWLCIIFIAILCTLIYNDFSIKSTIESIYSFIKTILSYIFVMVAEFFAIKYFEKHHSK